MAASPAVLVMAGAARVGPELSELLGVTRVAELERVLLARAVQWAEGVSPGRVSVAGVGERLAEAVARVFAGADGNAVLVVWPVLPRWLEEHSTAVLDDLAAGCEASVAPVFDGGLYLLALARSIPGVLDLPEETWDSPDVIGLVLAPINAAGAPVGLVRPERALRRPADVRAALADPLLDAELRALLEG